MRGCDRCGSTICPRLSTFDSDALQPFRRRPAFFLLQSRARALLSWFLGITKQFRSLLVAFYIFCQTFMLNFISRERQNMLIMSKLNSFITVNIREIHVVFVFVAPSLHPTIVHRVGGGPHPLSCWCLRLLARSYEIRSFMVCIRR